MSDLRQQGTEDARQGVLRRTEDRRKARRDAERARRAIGYVYTPNDCPEERARQEDCIRLEAKKMGLDLMRIHYDRLDDMVNLFVILDGACKHDRLTKGNGGWTYLLVTSLDHLSRADKVCDVITAFEEAGREIEIASPPSHKNSIRRRSYKGMPKSEQLQQGRVAEAKEGRCPCGPAAYGYRRVKDEETGIKSLKIHEPEAKTVRTIFREYLRIKSIKKLVEWLTEKGHHTRPNAKRPKGAPWSRFGISYVLNNVIYIGRVRYGTIEQEGEHEPIIKVEQFEAVKAMLKANTKRGGKRSGKQSD